MSGCGAQVAVPCLTHGAARRGLVVLDVDAVYLRMTMTSQAPDATLVWQVVALCRGHLIRHTPTPLERAALIAAGVVTVDDDTVTLLQRLASPSAADLAERALTEITAAPDAARQIQALRMAHCRAWAAYLEAMVVRDPRAIDSAAAQRLSGAAELFRRRLTALARTCGGAR